MSRYKSNTCYIMLVLLQGWLEQQQLVPLNVLIFSMTWTIGSMFLSLIPSPVERLTANQVQKALEE